MKNLRVNYENVKKSLGAISTAIVLTTITIGGLTGCSKEAEYKSNYSSTVYSVEKNSYNEEKEHSRLFAPIASKFETTDKDYAHYDRIINISESNRKEVFNNINIDETKEVAYPIRTAYFKSNYKESDKTKELKDDNKNYQTMTAGTFRVYGKYILPNSLKWIENYFGCGRNIEKTNEIIEMDDILGEYGNRYLNYKYTVIATEDISKLRLLDNEYHEKYGQAREIKKDDYITYQALYKVEDNGNLVLIANKQTGLGSEDENVKEQLVGNYDQVMIPITALNEKSESETLNSTLELNNSVFNEKEQEKVKTKK